MLKELSYLPPETLTTTYLNSNTQFITERPIPPGYIDSVATPKVRNRLILNYLGLNGLATTVINQPRAEMFAQDQIFHRLLNYCNSVNQASGLPYSGDLVIRSSARSSLFDHRIRMSEPAVLVTNAGSSASRFRALSDDGSKLPFLNRRNFFDYISRADLLLIHDDNVPLQRQAVHGRICRSPEKDELIIATDTIHSRGLSEKNPTYPYIILKMFNIDDLERIKPDMITEKVKEGQQQTEMFGIEYGVNNCSPHQAHFLLFKLLREQLMIRHALDVCNDNFGKNCVMEYRSYNFLEGGLGKKIHVLDVNY